jgi:biotin carboxyl carrier protein
MVLPQSSWWLDEHGEQGEMLVLPLQFVVAPDHGRFHPAILATTGDGAQAVMRGTLIGELRNHTTIQEIHSPFGGQVDSWLVSAGQIVTPGQPLCSLHPASAGG